MIDHVKQSNKGEPLRTGPFERVSPPTRKYPPYDSDILGDEIYISELSIILPVAVIRCTIPLSIEVLLILKNSLRVNKFY